MQFLDTLTEILLYTSFMNTVKYDNTSTLITIVHWGRCLNCIKVSVMYLLLGQGIQPLDVRGDKRVESAQNLIYRQGRKQETQTLHEPHALAALHTDTHEYRVDIIKAVLTETVGVLMFPQ